MTAEPDLLPLPEGGLAGEMRWGAQVYGRDEMHAYARACVAHATAAKDAEIDALRAEVATWEGLHASEVQVRQRWQARAERLAEALRPHIEDLEQSAVVLDQYPAMAPTAAEMRKAAAELRAALEQESNDA